MTGLLSDAELRELTDYKRPADQRRWLDVHGIPYWVGASGRPKVLWSSLEGRVGVEAAGRNWSAIR